MITFFRKIRKDFLSQGKMGKYLKYAIGEIVLVVIGILIALQVNDWNENRKSNVFEQEMLAQIQENIGNDKISLKKIQDNFKKAITSIDKIMDHQQYKHPDSLKFWLGDIVQFERFASITNSYEALKSNGLDKMSDNELRLLLSNYYDNDIKQVSRSITDVEYSFLTDWKPLLQEISLVDFKFREYVIVTDPTIFDTHSKARNNLILNKDNYAGGVNRISTVIQSIEKIEHRLSMLTDE
ncbi:MAG: DUF6090 family protein [Bacteroidota bacterium]|uniref:Uncharacterized protein n=1 Tax=Flagellimonas profundi TaxID=2915620 RepID=A0ABS3FBY4_9FLAO|nr:DUF6090 family protein [Allomuricauda profundi]MBO0340462.1 hypothetical protein [Allomuricauda profundi]MEC7770242.1 DUF6090 family protein [Bacteroidota bacterium]